MKQILAWLPPTSLRDGLTRTIDWYRFNKLNADAKA
jgi:hypothetical protein